MLNTRPIRTLIADDHGLFRDALRQLLALQPDVTVVGEAADGEAAAEACARLEPDVLLLDLAMPRLSGIEAMERIKKRSPGTAVVLLTASIERHELFEALLLGARGVILKTAETDTLLECIRTVAAGGYWFEQGTVGSLVAILRSSEATPRAPARAATAFTLRERQIMSAVMDGATNAEIGQTFGLRDQTVKNRLTRIFDKAGVSTRVELALYALHHRIGDARRDEITEGVGSSDRRVPVRV
jgi:DNA-binding NarL/FixJ family response regulator